MVSGVDPTQGDACFGTLGQQGAQLEYSAYYVVLASAMSAGPGITILEWSDSHIHPCIQSHSMVVYCLKRVESSVVVELSF